jgi:uncharacterized protein (DUF2141 family)
VVLVIAANGFLVQTSAAQEGTGALAVSIVGVPSDEGIVRIGIYDSREAFDLRSTRPEFEVDCPIAGNRCDFVIRDVRHGEYAVMAYHDKNKNREYDWGIFDRERVGVSNYGHRLWSSPDYDLARFPHREARTAIEIRLY